MTTTRYFVAGEPTGDAKVPNYEENFFLVMDKLAPNVLQESPEACKDDHLAHGMSEEFYDSYARIFRVTVEEVPKEELK